jgi:hypothetical protein
MSKSAVRSLPLAVVIAILFGALSAPAIAGQAQPNFGGILGAIIDSALRDHRCERSGKIVQPWTTAA